MIGDGWTDEPSIRPAPPDPGQPSHRRIAVVTGSRADFGLLRPVMHAIRQHPELELLVIAAGSHLLESGLTYRDVKAEFSIADAVPMQIDGRHTRPDDAEAVGRGVARFSRSFTALAPDWILVLGDRIEAFAAAAAASIGGWKLAHVHGGDRAEGVADDAMRHAITKLAHLHFPATRASADRLIRLGEHERDIHIVGSPAIDGLDAIAPMTAAAFEELGRPTVLFLMHPIGNTDEQEEHTASTILLALQSERVLALMPNHDPGRAGIVRAIEHAGVRTAHHLPRDRFIGLLKALADAGGILVGNSSAALIEAAALRLPAINIGSRQAARETPSNVITCPVHDSARVISALAQARRIDRAAITHPYGRGDAGPRIARILAATDPRDPRYMRKLCAH